MQDPKTEGYGGGAFTEPSARLLRLWTEQLYREYDHILFSHRLKLAKVTIRIDTLGSRWAFWDPTRRSITLSRKLIEQHSWDVVIEILKHEMAHQWVDDNTHRGRPHGAEFQRACVRLGVADWAIGASGELPLHFGVPKDRATSPEEERLLKRVEKLLALASSSNEHEALLAMERVQQMYAKYNVEQLRLKRPSNMVTVVVNPQKKRMEAVPSMIGSILGEHFFVRVIHGKLFDAVGLCHYSVMELLGKRENVLMAQYVYTFLTRQTERLWKGYREATGKAGRNRRSYRLGVLSGFSEKLRALKEQPRALDEHSDERYALMRLVDKELEAFVHSRYPRLTTHRWGGGRHEEAAFTEGRREGRKLNLYRPIAHEDGNRGRLLDAKSRTH